MEKPRAELKELVDEEGFYKPVFNPQKRGMKRGEPEPSPLEFRTDSRTFFV